MTAGPVCADEVGESLVGERERHDDAVGMHPAPALGEVPERQQQPVIDALAVGDRERDGEGVGASSGSVEELDTELRQGRDPRHESLVQDRHARRLEHRPADLGVDVRALAIPAPGPQDVAVSEQLDALAADHVHVAGEQTRR